MTRVEYGEGDWFVVPLQGGGFGVGLLARANRDGVLLGYFFGPKRDAVPSLDDLTDLRPTDALMVRRFGHLGLARGTWQIIGRAKGWDRNDWSMPMFVRYEELTGRSFHVFYDENDPNKLVREEQAPPSVDEQGAKDGLLGAGAVETVLATEMG